MLDNLADLRLDQQHLEEQEDDFTGAASRSIVWYLPLFELITSRAH